MQESDPNTDAIALLAARLDKLEAKVPMLEKETEKFKNKYKKEHEEKLQLQAQLAWFIRKFYGKRSDKISAIDKDQLTIPFEEWEAETTAEEIEALRQETDKEITRQHEESKANKPKTPRNVRGILKDERYPVIKQVVEPDESIDLSRYKITGHEYTRKLEVIPGMAFILEIDRPIYGLKSGNINPPAGQDSIIVAKLPPMIIDKGLFGNVLVSDIIIDKFLYYMPYYRQHQKYKNMGVDLKKNTIEDCFKPVAELMKPLADELLKIMVLDNDYLQCDGTVLPVIDHVKHKANNEYVWTLRSPLQKLICYNYLHEGSRGKKVADDLLKDFKGTLQTDDYIVYDSVCKEKGRVHAGCLAHMERYAKDSIKEDEAHANQAVYIIQQLYNVETIADNKNMNYEERKALRQELAAPMMDALEKWCKDTAQCDLVKYRPKGLLGKAVSHILKNIPSLRTYLNDGRIEIDNNGVERVQKNIVLGRKNWTFAGNHEAAKNACAIISLLASCKECGINPREWFLDVVPQLAAMRDYHKKVNLRDLLPDRWSNTETSKSAELCRNFMEQLSKQSKGFI